MGEDLLGEILASFAISFLMRKCICFFDIVCSENTGVINNG